MIQKELAALQRLIDDAAVQYAAARFWHVVTPCNGVNCAVRIHAASRCLALSDVVDALLAARR